MRRSRLILLALWLLSLAGISVSGGEITYGLFFLLTLIPVLALLYIFLVIRLFKIYQNVEEKSLVAHHPAVFSFILQNESPVFFSGVRVLFYSSFSAITGLDDQIEYELHPHSGIRRNTDIICQYRGEYDIGIRTIEVTDFFRLFTIAYRNPNPKQVLVKPDIIRLRQLKSSDIPLSSMKDSRVRPNEPDLLLREYVSGDDPRLINWKASTRSDQLLVRQRIGEQETGIGILMEPRRFSKAPREYLELENKLLETVIALNLYFFENDIPSETWIYGKEFESWHVTGEGGFDALYERLSAYRFEPAGSCELLFEKALRSTGIFDKNMIILVIHEWNSSALEFARRLNRSQVAVHVCIVGEDKNIKESGLPHTKLIRIPSDADLSEVL